MKKNKTDSYYAHKGSARDILMDILTHATTHNWRNVLGMIDRSYSDNVSLTMPCFELTSYCSPTAEQLGVNQPDTITNVVIDHAAGIEWTETGCTAQAYTRIAGKGLGMSSEKRKIVCKAPFIAGVVDMRAGDDAALRFCSFVLDVPEEASA